MSDASSPFTFPNPYEIEPSHEHPSQEPNNEPELSPVEEDPDAPSILQFALGVLVVIVLVGLGIGFFVIGVKDGAQEKTPPKEDTAAAATNSKRLRKGEGATLKTADGAELIIPEGALGKDADIAITRVSGGYLTDLYKLTPDYFVFLKPVTVRIPYRKNVLEEAISVYLNVWNDSESKKSVAYKIDRVSEKLETALMEF